MSCGDTTARSCRSKESDEEGEISSSANGKSHDAAINLERKLRQSCSTSCSLVAAVYEMLLVSHMLSNDAMERSRRFTSV